MNIVNVNRVVLDAWNYLKIQQNLKISNTYV